MTITTTQNLDLYKTFKVETDTVKFNLYFANDLVTTLVFDLVLFTGATARTVFQGEDVFNQAINNFKRNDIKNALRAVLCEMV